MARVIEKKIWPKPFSRVQSGEKDFELRLADFDIDEDDVILLREWNPETKEYTGREVKRKVKKILKFNDPTRFYETEELEKYGLYVIELGS